MENILFDELCIKRIKKYFLIFAIACVGFISAIYTPVYLLLSTNALWDSSIVLFLWTELIGPLMEFSFYWGSFAFLIYTYLRFGKKQIKQFIVIYAAAVVARYLFTMLATFSLMTFPGWKTFWEEELWGALFSAVMDCLQMLGVLLLAEFYCRRPLLRANPYSKDQDGENLIAGCFPIGELLNLQNPLSKVCFFSALIPAALKMLSRLYYDIFFWGAPQGIEEWLLIATYYVGDIAAFFIGYFLLLYLLQTFYVKEAKRQIEFES